MSHAEEESSLHVVLISQKQGSQVGRLIEELADTRDRQLPRRGDQPRFAMDVETGRYVNEGYSCVSDNVRGGTLDLMPLDGAQFIREFWGKSKHADPVI